MERDYVYNAAYNGSKNFTQHNVQTANANGFSAAADDYMERGIDLNEQLILNKPATFFFRMNGEAMIEDGINSNDILIVDRSIKAVSGRIVIAILDGELLVRRLVMNEKSTELAAANKKISNIQVHGFNDRSHIWGVVTCVIHIMESRLLNHNNSSSKKPRSKEDYRIMY